MIRKGLEFNPLSLTQKNGDCAWVWRKILHLGGIIGSLLKFKVGERDAIISGMMI